MTVETDKRQQRAPTMPLAHVPPGRRVCVVEVAGGRRLHAKLTAMGLRPGVSLKVVSSNSRGPVMVAAGNARLILGRGMAEKLHVRGRTNGE
jgi:Fe2+ transport system protein FeoA